MTKALAVKSDVVRKRILDLASNMEKDYLEISELLHQVYRKALWKEWKFKSFEDYIVKDVGIHERKAATLVAAYETLSLELKVPVKTIASLGWTKAGQIARVATEKNVNAWIAKAQSTHLRALTDEVDKAKQRVRAASGQKELPAKASDKKSKDSELTAKPQPVQESRRAMQFLLTESQAEIVDVAIARMKEVCKTESEAVALERICMEFLSGVHTDEKGALETICENVEKSFKVKLSIERKK